MSEQLEIKIWPDHGWIPFAKNILQKNYDITREEDGYLLNHEGQVTWLDNDGGLVCTCSENRTIFPCSHGVSLLALVEITRNSTRHGIGEVNRNRNGLYLELSTWAKSLMEALKSNTLDIIDHGGIFFGEEYLFPMHLSGEGNRSWGSVDAFAARILQKLLGKSIDKSDGRIWLPETAVPDLLDLVKYPNGLTAGSAIEKYIKFTNRKIGSFDPPAIEGQLDQAQIEGIHWLNDAFHHGLGGILADQMGVGKTLQIIAHVQKLREQGVLQRALIAVPAGAVDHWMGEIRKFTPDLESIAWEGKERGKLKPILGDMDIVITTHKLMTYDGEIFRDLDWTVYAFDEAQDAKNPESELAMAGVLIKADQKVAITGTPVENSLIDLHTLFTICVPGLLGKQSHFRRDISDPVKKKVENSEEILESLHKVVNPFMKSRTQESAGLSIPKPNIEYFDIEMEDEREIYEIIRDQIQGDVESREISIFHKITLLRQVSADYRLITKEFTLKESTKTRWIADHISRKISEGRKVLVFSTWTGQLDLIRQAIVTRNIDPNVIGRIDGSMTRRQRRNIEADFKEGHLMLLEITMKAGGRSLNLPEADDVVIAVPWWNPAVMMQAAYRAIRRGQTKTINVAIPIVKNSIEERLIEIQNHKSRISSTILRPSSGNSGLTRKQLMELINGS